MANPTPASPWSQGIAYCGGIAGLYGLVVAISAVTGKRFQIGGSGGSKGIVLPNSWGYVALFMGIGAVLWFIGRRWDAAGFVAVRRRRPWLVPTFVGVVVVPASLMLIFMLVR